MKRSVLSLRKYLNSERGDELYMNHDDLVSIVVPVYNVEQYISKCLDSLCNQTYTNIEIIVVDDSSPDNSAKIIKQFTEKDQRIKYIKRKNGGLGAARNTGIRESQGKYICFVDSDDWVQSDYLEKFIRTIREDNSDIVISNIKYIFSDGKEKPRTPHIDVHEIISNKESLAREFVGKQYKFHAPNKFCKKCLLTDNQIWFPEGKLYEDVFTTYRMLMFASKVSLIPDYTYFYLQSRSGSIMNTEIKPQRFTDMYEALDIILNNTQLSKFHLREEMQCLYVENVISLVNYIYPLTKNISLKEISYYKELVIKDKNYNTFTKKVWNNSKLGMSTKIRIFLIRRSFVLYCVGMYCIKAVLKGR